MENMPIATSAFAVVNLSTDGVAWPRAKRIKICETTKSNEGATRVTQRIEGKQKPTKLAS